MVYNESDRNRSNEKILPGSGPEGTKNKSVLRRQPLATFYEQRPERLFIGEMTHSTFPAHVHSEAELVILARGSAVMTIDGVRYQLSPGDAAVVSPLVTHSYDELSEDVGGLVAIFPPDIIPEYAGTFRGLQPDCAVLPAGKTSVDLRLSADRLNHLNMEENLAMCIAHLHVLLAGILPNLTYHPVYDYSDRGIGYRIISYISEHALEEITLESTSRALGISVSHLSHFFSERLHTHFRQFINAIRIERARLLMRDPNLTLTEICGICGYANMRTFRRAFMAEIGVLPSDHMAALRKRVSGDVAQ